MNGKVVKLVGLVPCQLGAVIKYENLTAYITVYKWYYCWGIILPIWYLDIHIG